MEENSLKYAKYWRNSLADVELGKGGLSLKDVASFQPLPEEDFIAGRVSQKIAEDYFKGEAAQVKTVAVVIRPNAYFSCVEHAQRRRDGVPSIVTPLVTLAVLARDGRLYPSETTTIPRDLLEPLERGSFTIASVADLDKFLTTDVVPGVEFLAEEKNADDSAEFAASWNAYLQGCERLLLKVCCGWPADNDAFESKRHGYLLKKDSVKGAADHILGLYDHIQKSGSVSAPLFDRFACEEVNSPEPCLADNAGFSTRLAHANDTYPLAIGQRNALAHLASAQSGEILAVNGPPGTGKTTLLLSVVASLWAKAALDGGAPPVILAASTNNQAVTNIIDAFGKDFSAGAGPFAGRWLPRIASFGAYFPAFSKQEKQAEKYQTRAFFDTVESQEYLDEAQTAYLKFAAAAFPELTAPSVDQIVGELQQRIRNEADKLAAMDVAWAHLVAARADVLAELGDDPDAALSERKRQEKNIEEADRTCTKLRDTWEDYQAQESIFYALFTWLPVVAKKRLLRARLFLNPIWPSQIPKEEWKSVAHIEATIKQLCDTKNLALSEHRFRIKRGEEVIEVQRNRLGDWNCALAPLGLGTDAIALGLAEVDELADIRIRFPILLLTTHYWEGRWLLATREMSPEFESEKRKKGASFRKKSWHRRMMLTPCVVSTFYMLPEEMKVTAFEQGFVDNYLYDFADLLIVDEAGQVLPEVAGASFALAKKALVIGDTLQIEPIWSIPGRVDIGNLFSAGLLPKSDNRARYDSLSDVGKTAVSGSVMRIAQCACRYHADPDLARGLFLLEHRRCFDEIISYCNALCYQGKLIPKRGSKRAANPVNQIQDGLPAMGYLHIDGFCRQGDNGSRDNVLEASTIADWLVERKGELETFYGLPLHQIVGVVTPFGNQVKAITQACREVDISAGNDAGEMTVGTVHALQGAERPVVIFSPAYSKHANGEFIDKSASMLNVAVSRAKNTFLVFGDMDVFGLAPKASPRGQLATLLFSDDAHALRFVCQRRRDLAVPKTGLTQLRDAREHDAFLTDVLSAATQEVHIVTPWIRLACLVETGALETMADAAGRGVQIHVYTDPGSNTSDRDAQQRERKSQELQATLKVLRERKIAAVLVRKVHSKILIGDSNIYCVGSYNWFSAAREAEKARHETSLVYRGSDLANEIKIMKESLRLRVAQLPR